MKPKVLTVGDDLELWRRFRGALKESDRDVVEAATYTKAVEVLANDEIDVVVSEVRLGADSGLDILQRVIELGLRCPVIILAEKSSEAAMEQSLSLGAFDFLEKSVRTDVFIRVVERGLHQKTRSAMEQIAEQETKRYRYRLLDTIFRSVNDAIVTVDSYMNVIEANRANETICGAPPQEMIGKNIGNSPFSCSTRCHQALSRAVESKSPVIDYHIECGRTDHPNQTVSLNTSPLTDEAHNFFGAVMIIKDVTTLSTLEKELEDRYQFGNIIGKSEAMKDVYRIVEALGGTETTSLITGETGVGKELIAKAIHFSGTRALKPFIAVNCSALAEELLESELFGHVKGAFTGAVRDKVGRFQMADGGTLFLDEIGDISHRTQLKLLRALQEREFEPVGSETTIKVDVRVIVATNQSLPEMIKKGAFREDLYYRLNVVELKLPPLRERRVDIPLLIDHFLELFNKKFGKKLTAVSEEAMTALMNHDWPGNIRELEHAIEHAFVLCRGGAINLTSLPPEVRRSAADRDGGGRSGVEPGAGESEDLEIRVIEALEKSGGNKAKAARLLGVSRQTIYRKIGKR